MVGAAGAAGAAELPQTPELGGLTTVDGAGLGKTVDSASQQGTEAAGDTGGKIVGTTLPAAGKTAPAVQKAAGGAAGSAGEVLGDAAGAATQGGLPTQGLPLG